MFSEAHQRSVITKCHRATGLKAIMHGFGTDLPSNNKSLTPSTHAHTLTLVHLFFPLFHIIRDNILTSHLINKQVHYHKLNITTPSIHLHGGAGMSEVMHVTHWQYTGQLWALQQLMITRNLDWFAWTLQPKCFNALLSGYKSCQRAYSRATGTGCALNEVESHTTNSTSSVPIYKTWQNWEDFVSRFWCFKTSVLNGETITWQELHKGAFFQDNPVCTDNPVFVVKKTNAGDSSTSWPNRLQYDCPNPY